MKVKMPELITIGETMVAMVPEDVGMLRYKRNLNIRIAGAESNVAMGVRKLGHGVLLMDSLLHQHLQIQNLLLRFVWI